MYVRHLDDKPVLPIIIGIVNSVQQIVVSTRQLNISVNGMTTYSPLPYIHCSTYIHT